MDIGRKILLALLTPLLVGLLFLLALDIGITRTATHPKIVKGVLANSGLYDSLVPNLLKQQGSIQTVVGDISTNDPLVQQAAAKALTPAEVQKKSEAAIDSIYAWLDGKTPQPDFSLSFTPDKKTLADNLAAEVQARLNTLPACTTPYTASSFDALNATCLPPGVTAATAADALRGQINSATIDTASVKASDFKSDSDPNKTAFQDQFKDIPHRYQQLQKLPVILLLLALLTAVAMVLLRRDWRAGLKYVGILVLCVGIIMLFFALVFNSAIRSKAISGVNTDNKILEQNLKDAARDLAENVNKNYIYLGLAYIVAGGVALAVPAVVKRSGQPVAGEPAKVKDEPKPTEPEKTAKS
jgi:hypothetical protein